MDKAQIIRDIAIRELGVKPATVTKWRQPERGIPYSKQVRIAELAIERGLDLTFGDLRRWPACEQDHAA